MTRRNRNKSRPQARRRADGLASTPRKPQHLQRVPIEEMVVPQGRCFFRSRHGKLRFTEGDVEKALKQARRNREAEGRTYTEARYYQCPPGGCGDYHLTSRTEYDARDGASS